MAISGISISVSADNNVNYVNYQAYLLQKEASINGATNQFCFLKSVLIKNEGEEDIRDATLRFEATPSFLEISNIPLTCLEKGPRGTLITRFQIFLDPQKLYELTETVVGSLRVTLYSKTGEMLATNSVTLHFNSLEESASAGRIDDILASFVTPNDPNIQALISKISDYKKEKYGTSSFEGYLSHDPNEVLKDAESVFTCLKSLQFRYAIAPASYEKLFQKVRLPKDVLIGRMGNCLDLSLLIASILEAIGLRPLLITLGNHCLVGVWLDDEEFAMPLEENGQLVINAASKGFDHLCVIESTALSLDSDASFQDAKDMAYKTLQEEKGFHYALDIKQCRNEFIWPIPSFKEVNGKKEFVIPSLKTKDDSSFDEIDVSARRYVSEENKKNKNRYDYWQDKLLDLNLANKLVNFKIRANTLQVMVSDAESFISFLRNNAKISLAEIDLNTPIEGKEIASFKDAASISLIKDGYSKTRISSFSKIGSKNDVAKSLSRKANTSLEESGCNPLFITLGLIRWYDTEISATHQKGEMYAPLILLPVKMPRRKSGLFYNLEYDFEDVSLNRTAFEYFKENYHLDFSSLNELPKDSEGNIDIRMVFNEIRRIISPMKNWLLLEEPSFLSLFSFSHFVMWSDLKNNRELINSHKIVSSFVNDERNWAEQSNADNIENEDVIFPLSADSSQIQAIYDAEKGKSFILDGPPGTGKSQTIANMIVNFLYHKKSVLFVAEKEAALDVVKRRLDDLSLGQFVLELANIQEPKSQVLETYQKLINLGGPIEKAEAFSEVSAQIEEKAKQIDEKISSIHSKGEFIFSPYQAIITYLENENSGDVYSFDYDFLSKLTENDYQKVTSLLSEIATSCLNFDSYYSSSFIGYQSREYSLEYRDALKKELTDLLPLLEKLKLDVYNVFSKNKCLKETRNNVQRFIDVLELLRNGEKSWSSSYLDENIIENEKEIKDALKLEIEIIKNKEKLLINWNEDFLSENAEVLSKEYLEIKSLSFFKCLKESSSFQKKMRNFLRDKKDKTSLKDPALKDSLDLLLTYQRQVEGLKRFNSYAHFFLSSHRFSHYPDGEEIYKQLDATLKIAKNLSNMDYLENKKERFATYVSDLDQGSLFSKNVNKLLADFYQFNEKKKYLKENYSFELDEYHDNDKFFGVLYSTIRSSLGAIGSLSEWTNLLLKIDEGEKLLGKDYLNLLRNGKIKENILVSNFNKSLSFSILSSSLKKDNLALLSEKEMNSLVKEYVKDVQEFSSLATVMTASKITENYPRDAFHFASSTEFNQLAKLSKNGGRGISLRQIFHNYKDVIKTLTPCFMMSPTSVSQFLDINDYKFDVVIFDEASQIPTSEAIASIARGKSVIIAGDEQQMPPTSFFTTNIGSNDEGMASLNEDLESLLDDALILGLPRKRLLWHYRSRHESLIAFSNNKFYDNSLYTFPSPKNDMGAISFRQVKGSYEKGKGVNRLEAKEVVQEIIRRLSDKEKRSHSIGVITFNEAQQNVVEDLLDRELAKHPTLNVDAGGEKIFVKNLENVQGDERDVILFSTTYGPDKNGTLSLNFGPLSLKKGERRLNVAISRAREEMVVFSSMDPSSIRADKAKNEGAQYLKDFLTFAKNGYDFLPLNASDNFVLEKGIEVFLAEDLRKLGYVVKENLGESSFKIDLAIALKDDPTDFVLGILIDNENFASMTCRDRHINEPNVLSSLGWNLFRIYSIEYLDHKEEIIQKIIMEINRLSEGEKEEKTNDIVRKPLFVKQVVAKQSIPYLSYVVEENEELSDEEFLFRLISTEQPISREQINRKYCEWKNKQRIGSRTQDVINIALNNLEKTSIAKMLNEQTLFYVKKDFDEASYRIYRVDNEGTSKRTLSDICYQEIANCAMDILKEQGEMTMDDLVKQISLAFGYKVLPQSKNMYLQRAIKDSNCKRNRIRIRENRVSLAQ